MATTIYFNQAASATGVPFAPASETTSLTSDGVHGTLGTSTSAQNLSVGVPTAAASTGPKAAPGLVLYSGSPQFYTTMPMSSAVTISGTIAYSIRAYESAMTTNATIGAVVWRIQPDGTASVISNKAYGTELGTTFATCSFSDTAPTSTACAVGDILAIALYADDATSTTMAAGTVYALDATASTVTFTETLSFSTGPSGTTTNLLADASDISGKKKLWTDAASASATYTVNTSTSQVQWTDSAGGTALEWVTPQLQAATVAGAFTFTFRGSESNTFANVSPLVRVYRTASDGTGATLVGEGQAAVELTASTANYTISGHVNTTLTDGQRLAVRVYTSTGPYTQASGYTASMIVEDSTATAIQWPATLTEYSSTPPTPRPVRLVPPMAVSQSSRW